MLVRTTILNELQHKDKSAQEAIFLSQLSHDDYV